MPPEPKRCECALINLVGRCENCPDSRSLPDRKAPRPFVVRICYECGQQQQNTWPQVCHHLSGCVNIGRDFVPVELFAVVLSEYDALRFSLGLVQDHANDCGCGAYEVAQEALDNSEDYTAALARPSDEEGRSDA